MNSIQRSDYFSVDEIDKIIKSCLNGKRCGTDGVFYEDLKKMYPEHGNGLTDILTVMLIH